MCQDDHTPFIYFKKKNSTKYVEQLRVAHLNFGGSFSAKYFVFMIYNRKFDQDLESVSSGLRRLKHLSKAFDDIIGRDSR